MSADPQLHLISIDQLHPFKRDNHTLLQRFCNNDRIYLVVDIGHIIVEPSLLQEYQQMAKELLSQYIYPDGVARYGFEITRITVTMAYQFIDKQIEQRAKASDPKEPNRRTTARNLPVQ